jgi:hypothetical protein
VHIQTTGVEAVKMTKPGLGFISFLAFLGILLTTSGGFAATQTWRATEGKITLSLDSTHLENLGMTIEEVRTTASASRLRQHVMEPPLYSFRMSPGPPLEFETRNGGFHRFQDGTAALSFDGGLAFRTFHPRTKAALTPLSLFDFAIEVDPDAERDVVRIVSRDSGLPVPLEVRSTAIRFTWNTGELAIMMGDLLISKAWADLLEQPYLAGQWIGVFDLELAAKPATGEAIAPATREMCACPGTHRWPRPIPSSVWLSSGSTATASSR